jgi:predicted transposase YdaD
MQFDATLKTMLEVGPGDWPRLVASVEAPAEVIDADIATVSGAADKVLRVRGDPDWILHLEFQVSPDAAKPGRLNVYNAVLEDRTGLAVRTALILLRPAAFLRAYTGTFERTWPGADSPYRQFGHDGVRVWELPPDRLLAGVGTLPLAPIGAVPAADVPRVLREMKARIGKRVRKKLAEQLWTSTYVLLGLRYEEAMYAPLFDEVRGMEESSTYQAIIRKGEASGAIKEAQRMILRLGEAQFGLVPNKKALAALMAVQDVEALERLGERLLTVETWEELLGLSEPRRGR